MEGTMLIYADVMPPKPPKVEPPPPSQKTTSSSSSNPEGWETLLPSVEEWESDPGMDVSTVDLEQGRSILLKYGTHKGRTETL